MSQPIFIITTHLRSNYYEFKRQTRGSIGATKYKH